MEMKTKVAPESAELQAGKVIDVALFSKGIKDKIDNKEISISFGNYVLKWIGENVHGFEGRYGAIDDKKLKKAVDNDYGKGTYHKHLEHLFGDAYNAALFAF